MEERYLGELVSGLMGVAQGTRPDVAVTAPALVARRDGVPVDRHRVELFDAFVEHLSGRAPEPRNTTDRGRSRRVVMPFFEAYFSNSIEGTEFDIDEAAAHATIMQRRPDRTLGTSSWPRTGWAAACSSVRKAVIGTLQAGWDRVRSLDDPFARAVTAMFVIAEVHPFDDGNGRIARIMMNTELAAAHQFRIIIPTVYRNNHLAGLRAMTSAARPDALVAVLSLAQRWTSAIDWSTLGTARRDLARTNALLEPNEAEDEGLRLQLP